MANTDLADLEPGLLVELGGDEASPDYGARINLLIQAVAAFNGLAADTFDVTATALDREATPIEKRALVLQAALIYMNGKALVIAGSALSHTNVAGRTDISGQPKAFETRFTQLRDQFEAVMSRLTDHAVAGETLANELGETKDLLTNRPPLPLTGADGRW